MASDFLKKKAQQQAESVTKHFGEDAYGGTKWRESQQETNGTVDGNRPSSTQKNRYISTRASSFLRKKSKEQAASVTERFGEDAYGGTKWRSENSELSQDALSRLLEQVQGLGTPGVTADTRRTSGGYYRRPVAQEGIEDIYRSVSNLTPALREAVIPVTVAQEELQAAEANLQIVSKYLQRAMEVYKANPSADNADTYNQIVAKYDEIYKVYRTAYDVYNSAYSKYKSTEDQAVQILNAYQNYSTAQQSAYHDWRGTIRDMASIQADLEEIDRRIERQRRDDYQARQEKKPWYEKLAGYLGGVQDTTLPTALVNGGMAYVDTEMGAVSADMRALLEEKELLQEELDWSRHFHYDDFKNASDFAEMSKYVSTANGQEPSALDIVLGNYNTESSGWDDPLYEYINGNEEAGAYLSNAAAAAYGPDNAIGNAFGRATESKTESQQMEADEVAIFNYLYATQGKEAAYAYYQYLLSNLNARQREADKAYWEDYAQKSPIASSIFSLAISPAKGLSHLGQGAEYVTSGKIDQNAAYNKYVYAGSAIRNKVANRWGPVGSFAYQTAMSMADFLMNTAITGGNEMTTLAIMGTGAAADATIEAKDRGLSDDQAFMLGTIAGAAEIITEKISVETLLNPDLLKNGAGKYILKNMLAEGFEEAGSDLINLIADTLVSKDQSEWQKSIDKYVADGQTEEEALALAVKDQVVTMGLDFLGGAISGGLMSGVNAGIHVNYTGRLGRDMGKLNLNAEDIQAFIETGLESDPETASYQLAAEMQAKIEAGETLSNYDLARLYQANMQAIQAEEEDAEDLPGDSQTDAVAGDVTDPVGLSMPSVENDTRATGFVTQNTQNGTQTQVNDTALPSGVPLSIADQLRREQAKNGGTQYERTYERAAGPATAQPAGELYLPGGAGISDGSAERNAGAGTTEQTGVLAGSAEQRRSAWADRSRATVARQNYARSLRLEKVNSLDLGLQNGTKARNIQVMPQESWDAEMSQLADRIYNETGKDVTYVMGRIQIRGNSGAVRNVRGVFTKDRIIVQADNLSLPMEQIADHEAYHAKVDFAAGNRLDLNAEIKRYILDTFSAEQFRKVLDKYIEGMRGVIDVNETQTGEEFEAAVRQIEEEIFADAYAGINAFSAGADQFTGAVNEKMDQLYMGKIRNQDNGTEEPTGPPSDRYSYAGENANNADLDALARAKEMQAAGVADETIRQQTGWHTGMDGKWRWEIDDSTMRYDSSGDIRGAVSAKWAMEDYESARDDLWGHADMGTLEKVRAYNRADIAGDDATKQELYDELINGQHAYYFDQYVEAMARAQGTRNAPAGGTLQDYIDHPALFEAYPQLRNVTLRFERMGGGMMGYYSRTDNEIVLNTELRYAAEDTLVHEIQHAIQKAEGFTRGSNEDYWKQRQDGDDAVHVYDAKIQDSEKKMDEIMRQLPENVAEQFRQWSAMDESSPEAMALMQELSEGSYADLFDDYFMLAWGLDEMRNYNHKRGPRDLYRSTAGEIEARDVSARRKLTAEQRRSSAPARADDWTVFVEDIDGAAFAELDAQYGPQLQSAAEFDQDRIRKNIQQVAQMDPVTGISGQEFAKGEVDLITQVETFFNQRGNRVYSPELGEVILDRKGVKSDIAHGIGRKKAAAFAAVPDVIEHGLVVDYQKDWKGRGYDTAVVAAPITIGNQTHEAAVILLRSDLTNRFYVHEVLAMENGALPFKTGTREGYPGGNTPSILSILERIRSVKNGIRSQERFSVDDTQTYAEIQERQQELRQRELDLQERKRVETNNPELLRAMDEYSSLFTEMRGLLPKRRNGTATQAELNRIETIKTLRNEYMQRIADQQESLGLAAISKEETEIREEMEALRVAADAAWAREGAERENLAIEKAGVSPPEYFRRKAIKAFKTTTNFNEAGYLLPDGKLLNFSGGERNHRYRDNREIGEIYEATNGVAALNRFLADGNIRIMAESPGADLPAGVEPTREQYAALRKFINSNGVQDGRFYVDFSNADGSRAGNYVYEGRIYADRVLNDIKHYYATGETVQRMDLNQFRYSVDDEGSQESKEQKPLAPKKKIRPVAESRPLIAKKDLRSTVLNLFSIPNGQRAEVGAMIDSYADRLIKNGSLTEDDRKAFFDRMYDAGVMVMPADEYSAYARSHIEDGRIYVSDSVKADFGDDWADIRRRAFAAGFYLVNDRSASGIDQWNATLSAEDMLPGLFDSEETDGRTILERIIQVAEEGKDEHLSLAEYTRRLSQQEGISEDEFLDNMERQMDWALRTFAEKARLEVHLRDRTGRKIAQEREKGAERMTRQQAKEAQRRADERQARKDSARRAKERRELRELQQRTLKQLQWLSRNRNRAPEELQATWDEVLGDIDLYAVSAADEMRWSDKHNATWKDLAQMYKDAMKNDPNFLPSKELERIVTRLDATKIADMDLGALQDLYKAAIGLRTEFYNRNNVINDEMQRLFAEVYTDAKREIESAPGGFTGGVADKFLNLDQLTPMNVLQRMAGWDPDGAFYSMAKQLERGERDMRAYSVKAQKMLQDFLTEHEDWVKKADGQGKDAIWYEVEVPQLLELGMGDKPIFGPNVKVFMTPAQKVHMYLESKNLDNLRHMTGGRTFVNKDLYSQGKRQEALSQGRTIKLAPETVRKLVSDLNPEEMELAQILDRYYNTFATQEINKVSNILYGYDKAMGKNYAPIYTNRNYTKTEFGVFDTTAEGVGNLKGRRYAVNPSYNISAFDAFERHVDQTARFCGMAIPARNWTTLMNWREKNNSTGDVITHKWGEEGKRYITDLITTLQAGDDTKTDTISSGIEKLKSNYISAVFGTNPSIVLKQLGSIPLASAYLDFKNFPSVSQIRSIDRSLISKYTQDLEWRTMGYSMPETKYLKDNPNWTQSNKVFGFIFGGDAITAMDGWAANTLWPWAENKVRREHPELKIGTKEQINNGESEFYKKVAEEFENAVARSQSTSDEIHQGTLRKSKNPFTRAFTMFRSDSAQTYNAIRQKIGEAQYYARTGNDPKALRAAKRAVGSAFMSAIIGYMWAEGIEFLMNLWKHKGKKYRDDDDELTAQSVMGEMVSGLVGDMTGIVVGGEELYDFIGGVLTDGTFFGIDTMGMEQLNDCLEALWNAASGVRDVIIDAKDILENGGDIGDYFRKHGNEMLGGIKDLAKAVTTYFYGLPANNVEAYLLGAVKWISPELGTAYDDLFSDIGKNDLSGLEGDALASRIGRILGDRYVSESDDTAAALAALYEAGYKTAIPSDTPTSVSVNGEKKTLGAYQQQAYDTIWGGIVADALDDLVSSENFTSADPEARAKMLDHLYDYAAEQAKDELFDEYELGSGASTIDQLKTAGLGLADCIAWASEISGMKQSEKFATIREWDMSEEAKKAAVGTLIGTEMETESGKQSQYAKMLEALSKGLTMDQYLDMRLRGTDIDDYLDLIEEGMDDDLVYEFLNNLEDLDPLPGEERVSTLQKWRASVDFSDDVEDQLTALSMIMEPKSLAVWETANDYGVAPDVYVTFQEIGAKYDINGNGSYTQAEAKAVIDAEFSHLTTAQKAVLWQWVCYSSGSKKNPYDPTVGQNFIDSREAAKTAAEE